MRVFLFIASLIAVSALIIISGSAVFEALKTGRTILYGWPKASIKETPIWFWLCVVIQGAVGIVCLATLLMLLIG